MSNAETRPRVGRNVSVTLVKGGGPERVAVEAAPDDWTPPAPVGFALTPPVECVCPWTPSETWLSAASCGYGGGYEPGSQREWDPDCPAHPPTAAPADVEPLRWEGDDS